MTRKSAREFAVGIVYGFFYEADPEELLEERLSPDFFDRLSGEDELFASRPDEAQRDYVRRVVCGAHAHLAELDGYIERYSVGWRFERLPRMAVAIMRVCMYECLYMPDIPNRASIDEAVEISKHYEPAEISAFINGLLGSFSRAEEQPREGEEP